VSFTGVSFTIARVGDAAVDRVESPDDAELPSDNLELHACASTLETVEQMCPAREPG
jgi:hypothetical protein